MKVAGLLMLPAGWFIILSALALLHTFMAQHVFVAAGIGVEILGLVLFARSHLTAKGGTP
jgi:hypothetical protein